MEWIILAAAIFLLFLFMLFAYTSAKKELFILQQKMDASKDMAQDLAALNAKQEMTAQIISESFQSMQRQMANQAMQEDQKMDLLRRTTADSLLQLRQENQQQLDSIRRAVDEKLQDALDKKLSESFSVVSSRLEQVYKSLGEMQSLAVGVGDLKKVLSNVKTRGILGELQLGAILEEILAPEQYARNVCTKQGSAANVEFAVILPGSDSGTVWLPIDSKYPGDAYEQLLDAYDGGNPEQVELARRVLKDRLRGFAKDIHQKYVNPPHTTDFALMFLPIEGLYAEAVRLGMIEQLQKEYKINLAGPTTLAALLNSLQLGFRTLAVQKRSAEVWRVLGAVKTEFGSFAKVLEATQRRLTQANEELDKLVGVRTRQIQRTLRNVELTQLPEDQQPEPLEAGKEEGEDQNVPID